MSTKILIILFLIGWYYICYISFIKQNHNVEDSPQLRTRLGTILWHSSDKGGVPHIYCYYPKNSAVYVNKGGEYLIKKVEKIEDCNDWFGATIFYEGSWVSEREKIWWSKSQKVGDTLIQNNTQEFNI